jgi:ribosomal-protein-alanine N-acetyltransferase
VAGFAAGAASGDDVAVLLHLAVAPASQGRGYGERLVRAFLHQAGEAGYAQTALVVDADNPARRLYTRIGFTPLRPVDAFHWCDMTGTP